MRTTSIFLLAAAACSHSPSATPDAYEPPQVVPMCSHVEVAASCRGGVATVTTTLSGLGAGSHSMCYEPTTVTAQCAAGCSVELSAHRQWAWPPNATGVDGSFVNDPLYRLTGAPSLMCAETPRAHAGDPCDVPVWSQTPPERRCMPMRADVDATGAVIVQNDLVCNAASVCERTAPPVVSGYLDACDPAVVTPYAGSVGAVVGASPVCLIDFDAAMQRPRSGRTIACSGDGECPDGALCDDQLMLLDMPSQRQGVCKPGPRGSLAMTPLVPG